MSLEEKFNEAVEAVKTFSRRPVDEDIWELDAYYKQATIGDRDTYGVKPVNFDLIKKVKWEMWNKRKGMSKEKAMEGYISHVNKIMEKYK